MNDNKNKLPREVLQFYDERNSRILDYKNKQDWIVQTEEWMVNAFQNKYMYNFDWLGRPIIQMPSEIVAVQEIIWKIKPDLIIETGIAHGGSLMLSASMLSLIDYCEAIENNKIIDPKQKRRLVVGVDIDVRDHNKKLINEHPLRSKIKIIEGSSINKDIVDQISEISNNFRKIMVFLDSNHTHDHVLKELELYSKFVTKNSYCVVFDTIIEDLPKDFFSDRPWDKGNSPKSALKEFLLYNKHFEIDYLFSDKLLTTASPLGFLKRID